MPQGLTARAAQVWFSSKRARASEPSRRWATGQHPESPAQKELEAGQKHPRGWQEHVSQEEEPLVLMSQYPEPHVVGESREETGRGWLMRLNTGGAGTLESVWRSA